MWGYARMEEMDERWTSEDEYGGGGCTTDSRGELCGSDWSDWGHTLDSRSESWDPDGSDEMEWLVEDEPPSKKTPLRQFA